MLENAISNLRQGIQSTIQRYPTVIAIAVIVTLLGWRFVHLTSHSIYSSNYDKQAWIWLLLSLCSLAMPVAFAAHAIYSVGKKTPAIVIFAVLPLLLLFFAWSVEYEINTPYEFLLYFLWSLSGHFLAAIAAFWHSDEINGFWQWNKQLFLRFLLSGLYSSVLYIGIAGALLAIRLLFNWKMPEEIFGYLFVTIGSLFQTTFFLGGLSSPISALQQETDYPKGLKLFTQYVLLPLLLIYFVILYFYMGKIILQFTLPKGYVCYLILGFSVVGILSILLLHPLLDDENETKWVRFVGKFFYFLLLPLTLLMLVSIGVRLGDYGITPARYLMLLLAFWLFCISLYFILSKKRNIIVIPASLTLVLFLCPFGPWGMVSVSQYSQNSILKQIFINNKLMKNDTLSALTVRDTLKQGEVRRIESILYSLQEMNGLNGVKKWVPQKWHEAVFGKESASLNTDALFKYLNIDTQDFIRNLKYENETVINCAVNCEENRISKGIETYNFKRIWGFELNDSYNQELITLEQNKNTLTFKTNAAEYEVDILPFLQNFTKSDKYTYDKHAEIPAEKMIIDGQGFKILVSNCEFNKKDSTILLTEMRGAFLFDK